MILNVHRRIFITDKCTAYRVLVDSSVDFVRHIFEIVCLKYSLINLRKLILNRTHIFFYCIINKSFGTKISNKEINTKKIFNTRISCSAQGERSFFQCYNIISVTLIYMILF